MPFQSALEQKLAKRYEPSSSIQDNFRGKDITFITNKAGDPITLYIGKRNPDGTIMGERYARKIQYAPDEDTILKSHWDLKGKVQRG